MKKIIIVIVAIVAVIIIVGVVFLVIFSGNGGAGTPPNSTSTGTLPSVTSTPPAQYPTGTVFQIGTSQGSVTVNNFYNNPVQVSQDQTSIVIAQSSTYNITYYTPDSSFNIGILQGPVSVVRPQAEAAFLAALGISQADACKLNVVIAVPYDVDPNYADQNIGLSFCPEPQTQ